MLQKWFNGLNKKQLILVRTVALIIGIPLIFLFGLGILIIATWLYFEFGKDKKKWIKNN